MIAVVKSIHYSLAHIFIICDETYLHLLLPVCKIANFNVYASLYFYIKKNLFISNVWIDVAIYYTVSKYSNVANTNLYKETQYQRVW